MRNTATVRNNISISIIMISVLLWVVLLFNPGNIMTVEHCHISMGGYSSASLQMILQMNPISDMMIGWSLMVFAMMLPKLIVPILHIYDRSFKNKRLFLSILFVLGYAIVWISVGFIMNAIIIGANLWYPMSYFPALLIGVIAVVCQFSPIKQRFLNRSHNHKSIAAFGLPAVRDAFTFGAEHGAWCVGSGWALMLFPMLLPQGHNIAMLLVTFIMVGEHMDHPRIPSWKVDFRLKLFKIFIAQTRMRLR